MIGQTLLDEAARFKVRTTYEYEETLIIDSCDSTKLSNELAKFLRKHKVKTCEIKLEEDTEYDWTGLVLKAIITKNKTKTQLKQEISAQKAHMRDVVRRYREMLGE